MEKQMNITYEIGDCLYLNITNKCPCDCTFCIRNNGDGAYGSDPLWLEHQPSEVEIIDALKARDLGKYNEIIFCGYGEPTCELESLKAAAKYIKSVCKTPIRLNTNGLSDLINRRDTSADFADIDTVSISLNAPTKDEYDKVTRPSFKNEDCFAAMLDFAARVKNHCNKAVLTVVDVIGEENIAASKKIADEVGIELRVRVYES